MKKIGKVLRFVMLDFSNLPSNIIYSAILTMGVLTMCFEDMRLSHIVVGVVLSIFTCGCSYFEISFFILKQRIEKKSLKEVMEEEGINFFKTHKISILVLVIISILRVISPPDQTIYWGIIFGITIGTFFPDIVFFFIFKKFPFFFDVKKDY